MCSSAITFYEEKTMSGHILKVATAKGEEPEEVLRVISPTEVERSSIVLQTGLALKNQTVRHGRP